jgi:hypothetical protein
LSRRFALDFITWREEGSVLERSNPDRARGS